MFPVTTTIVILPCERQTAGIQCLIVVDFVVHFNQEFVEGTCPVLLEFFVKESKLPQDVGITKAVIAREIEVGLKAVMNKSSVIGGQDTEEVNCLLSPLVMDAIPGEGFGTDTVEPVKCSHNSHAGFISVGNRHLFDLLYHCGLEWGKRLIGRMKRRINGGSAHVMSKEVVTHLADAVEGQQLLDIAVSQPGMKASAILDGCGDFFWPLGAYLLA